MYGFLWDTLETDEVVITEERISHIGDHHPGDYEKCKQYLVDIVNDPDYVVPDKKPFTVDVLKEIEHEGKKVKLILRIKQKADPEWYKNSILSLWEIGEDSWKRYSKKSPLYIKQKK